MKREAGKVFFASALGAGIGALVALEVVAWLWWVGLLVGGLVGYLSYEWRAVVTAIPKAYRDARGWQTPPHYWTNVIWLYASTYSVFLWLVMVLVAVTVGNGANMGEISALYGCMLAVSSAPWLLVVMKLVAIGAKEDKATVREAQENRRLAYCAFPPLVIFWHLPRGLWWIIRRIPRAIAVAAIGIGRGTVVFVRFLPRFGWQVFIRIHSEMRILCGTDAALGAAVGYFAGSAIIGAAVGGLFGVVNYALVTERWLRPRGYLPVRAKSA